MAKSKGNRVQVIMECTEHKSSGMPANVHDDIPYCTTNTSYNFVLSVRRVLKMQSADAPFEFGL